MKIVMISNEEQVRLDHREMVGLRQAMPIGWKLGDDIFARLKAAQIEWAPHKEQPSSIE